MNKCIFCLEPTAGSVEHIIPMALGNRTLMINDVCPRCNSLLGTKVDKGITDNFIGKLLREQHNLAGHSGKIPHPLFEGIYEDEIGEKYKIDLDGHPIVVPKLIDRKTSLRIVAPTKEQALRMGEAHLRRKGYSEVLLDHFREEVNAAPMVAHRPTLHKEFELSLPAIACGFLKIAYEFAYQQLGTAYLSDPIAQKIRKHLRNCMNDKTSYPKELITLMPDVMMVCLEGAPKEILHTIFLVSNPETTMVGISMFHSSAYSFLVRVSDNPSQYVDKFGAPPFEFRFLNDPIVPYAKTRQGKNSYI